MQLYPALDLTSGRLARGDAAQDPRELLAQWWAAGATWAHVSDLDRVFGTGDNTALVRSLVRVEGPAIQLGGGLTGGEVDAALDWGARRVIVGAGGTDGLGALVRTHGPDRIGLALDVRDGLVHPPGGDPLGTPAELLEAAFDAGVRTVVYRDLGRDGRLAGADLGVVRPLLGEHVALIIAGGIASLDDLRAAHDSGLAGAIVGRSLLERRFTIEEALACCG